MRFILISIALILSFVFVGAKTMQENEIRIYDGFRFPVDPGKVVTLTDMDVSYALADTLVEWDEKKNIVGGLASSWKFLPGNIFRFTLRDDATWSDGTQVTCDQVKRSLERIQKLYSKDTHAFF